MWPDDIEREFRALAVAQGRAVSVARSPTHAQIDILMRALDGSTPSRSHVTLFTSCTPSLALVSVYPALATADAFLVSPQQVLAFYETDAEHARGSKLRWGLLGVGECVVCYKEFGKMVACVTCSSPTCFDCFSAIDRGRAERAEANDVRNRAVASRTANQQLADGVDVIVIKETVAQMRLASLNAALPCPVCRGALAAPDYSAAELLADAADWADEVIAAVSVTGRGALT